MTDAAARAVTLADRIPVGTDPDLLLDLFVDWAAERNLELYEAQEEAILELLSGHSRHPGHPHRLGEVSGGHRGPRSGDGPG